MQQPQGESIWGTINTCAEIGLHVYYIYAEHGEGLAIKKEKAAQILSEKGVAAGKESGEFLCYGRDDTMDIPLYEILEKRLEFSRRLEEHLVKQMEEIRQHGHISLPEYFGECPPPRTENPFHKIRNGIYFVDGRNRQQESTVEFAVEKTIAENFLSPMAYGFGEERDGYLYFSLSASAVPLYELKGIYKEVQNCITSEVNLLSTICEKYPDYRDAFNEIVIAEEQIPESHAIPGPFLSWQEGASEWNGAQKAEREQEIEEEQMEEYGESVDYGYEP